MLICVIIWTRLDSQDIKDKKLDKIISPEIRSFLDKLLTQKKIEAQGALRDSMISDLNDRLEVRFNQLIVEHLSVAELETLAATAEEGPLAVQSFLRKTVKNIDELFAQAMQEFAETYLEG